MTIFLEFTKSKINYPFNFCFPRISKLPAQTLLTPCRTWIPSQETPNQNFSDFIFGCEKKKDSKACWSNVNERLIIFQKVPIIPKRIRKKGLEECFPQSNQRRKMRYIDPPYYLLNNLSPRLYCFNMHEAKPKQHKKKHLS